MRRQPADTLTHDAHVDKSETWQRAPGGLSGQVGDPDARRLSGRMPAVVRPGLTRRGLVDRPLEVVLPHPSVRSGRRMGSGLVPISEARAELKRQRENGETAGP